jgi:hypothetical protein
MDRVRRQKRLEFLWRVDNVLACRKKNTARSQHSGELPKRSAEVGNVVKHLPYIDDVHAFALDGKVLAHRGDHFDGQSLTKAAKRSAANDFTRVWLDSYRTHSARTNECVAGDSSTGAHIKNDPALCLPPK